jgi:hypothetical protein
MAAEFQAYVRRVAVESDRFEYLLTGEDKRVGRNWSSGCRPYAPKPLT